MKKAINRFLVFFLTIGFESIGTSLFSQHSIDSSYETIPLEAYDEFNQDSFLLPGHLHAQVVYPYGHYQSKVKINLDGIGEVFVHHVLSFVENDYSFVEFYSRKPAATFIFGIKRYGGYRMYETQFVKGDSSYSGTPKIEFMDGLNSIRKTIYPLSSYDINNHQELKTTKDNQGVAVGVELELKDCMAFGSYLLDESVRDISNNSYCSLIGGIQYSLENGTMAISLILSGGDDNSFGAYESFIYDSIGTNIGHVHDIVPLRFLDVTKDKKYVYVSTGGTMSEDYVAPFTFKIFELASGKVIFSKKSTTTDVAGGVLTNTSLGVYTVCNSSGGWYSHLEAYIIDLDKDIMYAIHQNPLCQPPFTVSFFSTYCECWHENGLKAKLQYDKDFPIIKFTRRE